MVTEASAIFTKYVDIILGCKFKNCSRLQKNCCIVRSNYPVMMSTRKTFSLGGCVNHYCTWTHGIEFFCNDYLRCWHLLSTRVMSQEQLTQSLYSHQHPTRTGLVCLTVLGLIQNKEKSNKSGRKKKQSHWTASPAAVDAQPVSAARITQFIHMGVVQAQRPRGEALMAFAQSLLLPSLDSSGQCWSPAGCREERLQRQHPWEQASAVLRLRV